MDAKTFVNKKHETAVEELKAIEAEYLPKMEAAKVMIALTKKWMDELGNEKASAEPPIPPQESSKNGAENWVSARDLAGQSRQN